MPPTINFEETDPGIDSKLKLTFNEAVERKVDTALTNTFGFGGHNTSAVFTKFKS